MATDVLGAVVERIEGKPFAQVLQERIFGPLGMVDTDFHVPAAKHDRFAANYAAGAGGKLDLIDDPGKSRYLLDELLADTGSGHRVESTVFVECGSFYREDGPEALRPVPSVAV